jgi:hypothetical protein
LEDDPNTPLVVLSSTYMSLEPPEQIEFCLDQVSLHYLHVNTRAGSAARLHVFGTPRHWRLSLKPLFTSSNSILVLLFLGVLRLLAGRVPQWLVIAPQDHDNHWRWCIGCQGATSLDRCSRTVNVIFFHQSSSPRSLIERSAIKTQRVLITNVQP